MGQAQSLATEIEIDASPETVRSVFMDFSRFRQWSNWTIEPIDSASGKKPAELTVNDTLKVDMKGTLFRPAVVENTPAHFSWEGNAYGLLVGKHEFIWSPSEVKKGGTRMVQAETFRGPLAFLFGEGWSFRAQTLQGWNAFFEALKKECERVEEQEGRS